MRRAHRTPEGDPVCRRCGSERLWAKSSEAGRRRKTLKCAECGEKQRYRSPKHVRV